jgi:hypothetical protein
MVALTSSPSVLLVVDGNLGGKVRLTVP